MPITEFAGSATISTTEYSLPNASTTLTPQTADGVLSAMVDFSVLQAGDQYRIRVYEKVRSTSAQSVLHEAVVRYGEGTWVMPAITVMHGWDITLLKLAGADRTIESSVRLVPVV